MGSSTKPESLKQVLNEKGLTETELIRRKTLSASALSRWQSGAQVPKLDTAIRFCAEADLSLKEFANLIGLDTTGVPDDIPESLEKLTPTQLLALLAAALGYSVVPIQADAPPQSPNSTSHGDHAPRD